MNYNSKDSKDLYRITERIRVPEVRLVGDNVEPGIYPTREALRMAQEQELIWWKFPQRRIRLYVASSIIRNSFISKKRNSKSRKPNR